MMITAAAQALPVSLHSFRVSTPCPWHLMDRAESALCWQDKPGGAVWFALGRAQEFASLEACRHALRGMTSFPEIAPRGFAVVSFDGRQRTCFFPRLLLNWKDGQASGIAADPESLSSIKPVLDTARGRPGFHVSNVQASSLVSHPLSLTEHSHFPRDNWRKAVRTAQAEIAQGALEKVVLSRQVTLMSDSAFEPAAVLSTLAESADDSIVFAYQRADEGIFLGATPERLFQLRGDRITVDSLAGSRPRGATLEADQQLAQELLHSAKDRHEQELVTQHIAASLGASCDQLHLEKTPRVRKLSTVQHLHTTVDGKLRSGITLDDVLKALHPTPATCGLPVEVARKMIAELEPEPRGFYAGVIGWIGVEDAEFAVMIRSGLIQGETARIFGGAGIVALSDPDSEYDECAWKMEPLRRALRG